MKKLSLQEEFSKLMQDENFKNKYLLFFLDRFVYATADIEDVESLEERQKIINNLLESLKYISDLNESKLSPYDFAIIASFINKDNGLGEGFRKVNVTAGAYAEWIPVPKEKIYYSLYSLLDNYYNVWTFRDVYEKESEFHIRFMRIHPFEDGNKRVSKIILNSNLVRQNCPPVVITEGETKLYYSFINNEDVEGFAKFLREKSMQEFYTIVSYYKVLNSIPIQESLIDGPKGRK